MSIQNSAVEVHNPSLFSEILGDGRLQVDVGPKPASKTVGTDISIQVSPRGKSRCSTSQPGVNAVEWLSRKARRAVVALPDDPDLTHLKQTCETIIKTEHTLLSELNELLAEEEGYELSKRAMLYKKWNERVFKPIHKEIAEKMESQYYHVLDNQKRELFEKYLEYSAGREVFLDTVSYDEYSPDDVEELKANVSPLSDPLQAQTCDACSEKNVITGCEKGIPLSKSMPMKAPHGQRGSEAVMWLAMKLVYIDSDCGRIRRNRVCRDHNKCTGSTTEEPLRIPHKRKGQCNNSLSLQWKEDK